MFIRIPIGNFTGNELLAGRGPKIEVKIVPVGSVSTDYKTEFISTGINQKRHRIYLEIKSKMTIVAPFTNKTVEVINNVNVAETVLIGNVPDTFYNLEGLTDFTTDDSMNLID
jgi:sporulation protein YunB